MNINIINMGCVRSQQQKYQSKPSQSPTPTTDPNSPPSQPLPPIKFCPIDHPPSKPTILTNNFNPRTCNKCSTKYDPKPTHTPLFACSHCEYQECCRCLRGILRHEHLCGKGPEGGFQLLFWNVDRFDTRHVQVRYEYVKEDLYISSCLCSFCCKELRSAVKCGSCGVYACAQCMDIMKNSKCSHHLKFDQRQSQTVCHLCQSSGQNFIYCSKCKLIMCRKCHEQFQKNKELQLEGLG